MTNIQIYFCEYENPSVGAIAGGASYLAVALLTAIGTTLAIKIKDAIAHRKQV